MDLKIAGHESLFNLFLLLHEGGHITRNPVFQPGVGESQHSFQEFPIFIEIKTQIGPVSFYRFSRYSLDKIRTNSSQFLTSLLFIMWTL